MSDTLATLFAALATFFIIALIAGDYIIVYKIATIVCIISLGLYSAALFVQR